MNAKQYYGDKLSNALMLSGGLSGLAIQTIRARYEIMAATKSPVECMKQLLEEYGQMTFDEAIASTLLEIPDTNPNSMGNQIRRELDTHSKDNPMITDSKIRGSQKIRNHNAKLASLSLDYESMRLTPEQIEKVEHDLRAAQLNIPRAWNTPTTYESLGSYKNKPFTFQVDWNV